MTGTEKENWVANIEYSASRIEKEIGYEAVATVLGKYGVDTVEDLQPWQYSEVFGELYAVEADLK